MCPSSNEDIRGIAWAHGIFLESLFRKSVPHNEHRDRENIYLPSSSHLPWPVGQRHLTEMQLRCYSWLYRSVPLALQLSSEMLQGGRDMRSGPLAEVCTQPGRDADNWWLLGTRHSRGCQQGQMTTKEQMSLLHDQEETWPGPEKVAQRFRAGIWVQAILYGLSHYKQQLLISSRVKWGLSMVPTSPSWCEGKIR